MLFKSQYPISTKLKRLLKGKNLTGDDLKQARALLQELTASDECRPVTREHACAFEVVIYMHEKKLDKAVEIANKLANTPGISLFDLQAQINLRCYNCGFKQEWNKYFTQRG